MRQRCIETLEKSAGRPITIAERRNIEKRIIDAKQELIRKDQNAYLGMTEAQQLQEAGKIAADQLKFEADKRKQHVASTIMAHDRISEYMKGREAAGLNPIKALWRSIGTDTSDGKSATISMESLIKANSDRFKSLMVDTFEALDRKFLGVMGDPIMDKAFRYEVRGEDSSTIKDITPEQVSMAKRGAEAWNKTNEIIRTKFNRLGGAIGKIANYIPQDHSQLKVARAGAEKWGNDIIPLLDRRRYNNLDGSLLDNKQIDELFKGKIEDGKRVGGIFSTIATGGANDMTPGRPKGRKMVANRNTESRVIHFKNADSQILYDQKYGDNPLYDKLVNHVNSMSKDIGSVEHFGANPDLQFRYWLEDSMQKEILADPVNKQKIEANANQLQAFYNYMQGSGKPIVNHTIARYADTTRNFISGVKLPLAPLTILNHLSTTFMTAHYNGLPIFQTLRNIGKSFNPLDTAEEGQAQRLGLSLETLTGNVNQWAGDHLGAAWTKYASGASIRLSGLNAIIEGMRRAFGTTMYGSIGKLARDFDSIGDIKGASRRMLDNKGITDNDFQVWKKAGLEDWGGGNNTMLVPENIYALKDEDIAHLGNPNSLRESAAIKLMAMVDEESHNAVITPTATQRFKGQERFDKGTVAGELARSFYMFKSIPQAQIARNYLRGMSLPTGAARAGYIASYIAGSMFVSGMVVQLKELAAGRDPENMVTGKFWADTMTKGGILGLYGDLLFSNDASKGLERFAGPLYGEANDLYKLTVGNAEKSLQSKKTSFKSDLLHFGYNNLPLKTWYNKAILDRLIFNDFQENISPGYMQRMNQRARAAGQSYYYPPQNLAPSRFPDLTKAIQK